MSVAPAEAPIDTLDCWDERQFSAEHIRSLAEEQLERVDAYGERDGVPKEFALVIIDGKNPASALGREVEKEVFWEHFKNDLSCLSEEYDQYDPDSVFIVAIDVEQKNPAGVIRMIPPKEGVSHKSIDDIADPRYPWSIPFDELEAQAIGGHLDLAKTIDVATLAIKKEYRQGGEENLSKLSSYMYYAMYQWTRAHELINWVGIIDTKALPGIQELANPLDLFEGVPSAPYIDSADSIPFYANLDRIDSRIEPIGIGGFFIRGEGHDPRIVCDLQTQL